MMVTRATLINLSKRIAEVAAQLGLAEQVRVEYRVALRFEGQSEQEFLAQYPWWDKPGGRHISLTFDSSVPVPRTEPFTTVGPARRFSKARQYSCG